MELLRRLAFAGGDWVIWVLIALSVVALAVVLERLVVFRREGVLSSAGLRAAEAGREPFPPFYARRRGETDRAVGAARDIEDRLELERRLVVLGTLGALSPFVGLFGTVLGIIRAFRDLAQVGSGHPEIVMQGIAEALIATAAGIFVAMISVACYNFFNRRIKEAFAEAERLGWMHGWMGDARRER